MGLMSSEIVENYGCLVVVVLAMVLACMPVGRVIVAPDEAMLPWSQREQESQCPRRSKRSGDASVTIAPAPSHGCVTGRVEVRCDMTCYNLGCDSMCKKS